MQPRTTVTGPVILRRLPLSLCRDPVPFMAKGTHVHRTSIDSLFFSYGQQYTTESPPCQYLFF